MDTVRRPCNRLGIGGRLTELAELVVMAQLLGRPLNDASAAEPYTGIRVVECVQLVRIQKYGHGTVRLNLCWTNVQWQ